MKVLLAHPGTQHSFALAEQLHRRNLLHEFWTCFALSRKSLRGRLFNCAPGFIRDRIYNRLIDLPSWKLRTLPYFERKARRDLARGVTAEKVMFDRNTEFQELISKKSIDGADIVVGFDTSSWVLIDRARRAGKRFVLDQSIAHPRASQDAAERVGDQFPDWSESFRPTMESLLQAQVQEHARADLIVVASSFTRDSLVANGTSEPKIRVNPYGVDLQRFHPSVNSASSRPLRFVFVGALTARKGVPVLLAAWKKLQPIDAELWMVGDVSAKVSELIQDSPGLKILGRRSRDELPEVLRSCDVFVFPSYFEGFGLVLLEAMASGLPIIATEATAAPDLIDTDDVGRLIQSGNVDQLVEAIKYFIDHRNDLPRMSKASRARAEQFSWSSYGDRWAKILSSLERGTGSAA